MTHKITVYGGFHDSPELIIPVSDRLYDEVEGLRPEWESWTGAMMYHFCGRDDEADKIARVLDKHLCGVSGCTCGASGNVEIGRE